MNRHLLFTVVAALGAGLTALAQAPAPIDARFGPAVPVAPPGAVLPAPPMPAPAVPVGVVPAGRQLDINVRGEAELLMWWLNDRALPPLVTTSTSQASAGLPGRPDARMLFGGKVDGDVRNAGRYTVGLDGVLRDPDMPLGGGVELVYFNLGGRTNSFAAASTGEPLLARPFVDPLTGTLSTALVANLPVVARPASGRVAVRNTSSVYGTEVNATLGTAPDGDDDDDGYRWMQGLIGFRHFALKEGLCIGEDRALPAAGGLPAASVRVTDDFRARNNFYGPQVGYKSGWRAGRWSSDLNVKVALGCMSQALEFRGGTAIGGPGVAPVATPGGLLVPAASLGTYRRQQFCYIPELTWKIGIDIVQGARLSVGYNFLYVSDVVRVADQAALAIDPRAAGARPSFALRGTDLWVHGLILGMDVRY